MVGAVLVAVCVVLWIAVCAHVIQQDGKQDVLHNKNDNSFCFCLDICDSSWQSSRDALIISAFFFSLLALIDVIIAATINGFHIIVRITLTG